LAQGLLVSKVAGTGSTKGATDKVGLATRTRRLKMASMNLYVMVSTENLGVCTTRPKILDGIDENAAMDAILAEQYQEAGARRRIYNLGLERYYRVRPEMKEVAKDARKAAEARKELKDAQKFWDDRAGIRRNKGDSEETILEYFGKRPE
jgi:hypothetical protein